MTKNTETEVKTKVIDAVEVIEEAKPKKRAKRKPSAKPTTALVKRVTDSGDINLSGLSTEEKEHYSQIAKSLNVNDMTSVTSYGSDLQRAMDSYSSDFLKHQMSSTLSKDSSELISKLMTEIGHVELDDLEAPTKFKQFLRRIPLLKKFVMSLEELKTKYNTIEENIDEITKKLEATRQIAIRDNNALQHQFENNLDYVNQIEELIIAGKLKSNEIEEEIHYMEDDPLADDYKVADLRSYKGQLDKRLTDLVMLRYAFKQSLVQIRIIQETNLMDATNTEAQITMAIPLWKNQLSLAVALYNQKQSIEVKSKVTDATNQLLMKNSEMMKTQAVEVVRQNQRSVIDVETLRKTTDDLLATIESVKKAQAEGASKRASAEAELMKLESKIRSAASGVAESTKRIIAKELENA